MRNLPIISKILLVVAVFGVFAVSSALFSAVKIHEVAAGFESASAHEGEVALSLSRAATRLQRMRGAIAELQLSDTAKANEVALADMEAARTEYLSFLDKSITAMPSLTAQLT